MRANPKSPTQLTSIALLGISIGIARAILTRIIVKILYISFQTVHSAMKGLKSGTIELLNEGVMGRKWIKSSSGDVTPLDHALLLI